MIKLSWLDKYKASKNVAISKSYILRKKAQELNSFFTFHGYLSTILLLKK